ncbi:type I restriction-modification system subunit M [Parendozoicomonas haliclonae]|uniref:site-specific DNA-methyltransferase (adenine-specific) n=1 Tax=Parendozoicomonas haliclonae TaxID=1960125 RepID=A0A1X7AIP2_9GAMM|nr:class I SAM-dependent DNA methyltransferase [Parendozoicomonas haliclonae]SMA45583.1 putative type I restriction enzymeP M protein [Parendozoicomonas haliclonae]
MITGELKGKIDKLWEEFWVGGITNPLTVIEQITYLLFTRMLDMHEAKDEQRKMLAGIDFTPRFQTHEQDYRFRNFSQLGADEMMEVVRDEVFRHFRKVAERNELLGDFMTDARLEIVKPSLLVKAVEMIKALPLDRGDTKGDLYEYLLSKLTTAGINGQFRTPRHIIRAMVEMMEPNPARGERICDPSCGTGGFLSVSYEYLLERYSSLDSIHTEMVVNEKGALEQQHAFSGNLLAEYRKHVDTDMFHGYDFDSTMLRIAAMNLIMHGIEEPDIHYQDTMSQSFSDKYPDASHNGFHLILANPPFTGTLDAEDIDPSLLKTVSTKKTELLFVARILQMLKIGGRSATVVPQGVLFGSSKAHQSLRQKLVEDNQLEAVINLPSGVFKPYAGVATAILIFAKGGETDNVWFYDLQNDGYSLDDKRNPIAKNDIPHMVASWKQYRRSKNLPVDDFIGYKIKGQLDAQQVEAIAAVQDWTDRTKQAFIVPKADIASNKYDLSINRYKEVVYQEEQYEPPKEILARLKALEVDIQNELEELEAML